MRKSQIFEPPYVRCYSVFAALCLAASALLPVVSHAAPALTVKSDHPKATYRQGEEVSFLITATDSALAKDAELTWKISKDGVAPVQTGTVRLVDGAASVNSTLNEPGFLLCTVTAPLNGSNITAHAGAAIDPLLIKPSMPVPDDFDSFWAAQKKKLAAVPLNPRTTSVDSPPGYTNAECFDVEVDCTGGAPVSGYYAKPLGAKPKSLPAILLLRGAGVSGANLTGTALWCTNGMLAMEINAHGIPNGKPAQFYTELAAGRLKSYSHIGRESRDSSYFVGMFLRVLRAIDFLAAQPEWDGKTLIAYGSSQGGFQALAASGLDERVTFIAAGVPAGCDHAGVVAGRVNGWPKLVPNDSQGRPDPAILQASRYIDCVNFASRAKAKAAFLTVGFIDQTCPPTTVYATFNNLTMPKAMFDDIPTAHANSPEAMRARDGAVFEHIKAQKAAHP